MADEYISRKAAIDRLEKLFQLQASTARVIIEAIPAADVAPVRHGRWIEDSDPGQEIGTAWRCSSCDLTFGMEKVEKDWHHYCPNCGAKMDGEA